MFDCTMLDGIIYGAVWYNICHPKVFGVPCQRLWRPQRKTFANAAKVFRTPMFIPRSVNVCTIENYGLYHNPSSQEAHFGIKTMRFTTQKCHTFDPKLPWFCPLNRTLASAEPHSPKQPHIYVQHFFLWR